MSAYIEFIIGGVFVVLYSFDRINNPKIDMKSTTELRYWTMVLAYLVTSVLLFVTLSLLISTRPEHSIIQYILKLAPDLNKTYGTLSPPLLVTLAMTVLFPKLPGLSKMDEAVRREFRHRASLSRLAGNLSHLLVRSNIKLSAKRRELVMQYMKDQEISQDKIVFEKSHSPQYLWTKISVLMYELQSWEDSPIYSGFVKNFHDEWKHLIKEAEVYEAKATRCFTLDDLDSKDGTKNDKLVSALHDCRKHYADELARLLQEIGDYMGRGITQCIRNSEARQQALMEIGIDVKSHVGYTMHQITVVFLLALGVTIVLPMLYDVLTQQFKFSIKPYMFKIAFSYVCAGLAALYIHRHLQVYQQRESMRPWWSYFRAGVIATLLAITAGIAIDVAGWLMAFGGRTIVEAIDHLLTTGWIYQLRTFLLAILLIYMLDTPVKDNFKRRQWIEAVVTALAMAVVALVIYDLIKSRAYYSLDIVRFLFSSITLGGLVGYWLPNCVRQTAERVSAEQPAAEDFNLQSAASV